MPSLISTLVALAFFLPAAVISDNPQTQATEPFKKSCIGFFAPVIDDERTKLLTTKTFTGPFGYCASKSLTDAVYCRTDSCAGGPAGTNCKQITSGPEDIDIKTSGPPSNQTCALAYILGHPYKDPKDPTKTVQGLSQCMNGTGYYAQCDSVDTESKSATPIVCEECLKLPMKKLGSHTNPTGTNEKSTTTTETPPPTEKPNTQVSTPVGVGP